MRADEVYRTRLVPTLYRVPVGSYRGNSLTSLLKVPNLFIAGPGQAARFPELLLDM